MRSTMSMGMAFKSTPCPRLSAEDAIRLIDRNLPPELATQPRWTFARALLVEAIKTGKSRDLTTATRQLTQALRNERWLVQAAPDCA